MADTNIGFFDIGKSNLARLRQRPEVQTVWSSPEDHAIVGAYLEAVRKRVGLTQVELASRLGKPQSFVSSHERGQRRVDFAEFADIALALGQDPTLIGPPLLERVCHLVAKRRVGGR